jgi:hypothetical protein
MAAGGERLREEVDERAQQVDEEHRDNEGHQDVLQVHEDKSCG